MAEKSEGKDTTTGHWEIAGLVTHVPFSLFPQGFPAKLLTSFIREAEIPGVLANRPASGTEIIVELGDALMTLGQAVRRKWGKCLVAVTGSTGKSTTKE